MADTGTIYDLFGFTHTGSKRPYNQDRILVQDKILDRQSYGLELQKSCQAFVADGVGGLPAGEKAARILLEGIQQSINGGPVSAGMLNRIFGELNQKLFAFGEAEPQSRGLATTLVGLFLDEEGELTLLNVGDSEAWLFRAGNLEKLTEDHVLDRDQPNSPITQYFGGKEDHLQVSYYPQFAYAEEEDIFLLCSDGLRKSLSESSISEILSHTQSLSAKGNQLLQDALEAGAPDNISVILIYVAQLPPIS
ncbi:MAG: protein phosphatase 2C domain-containing protein [Bacteroidota bacterium]